MALDFEISHEYTLDYLLHATILPARQKNAGAQYKNTFLAVTIFLQIICRSCTVTVRPLTQIYISFGADAHEARFPPPGSAK
ncbi:MAG: hypothetical protein P4L51_11115 [Puia sp.]|nr:hypothetical protein [Puia sp.]